MDVWQCLHQSTRLPAKLDSSLLSLINFQDRQWTCLIYFVLYRMTPPPPKFGSRNLFNDSFLSFLRWNNNKSQLAPPVHHPDSPGGTEELQEKRYLLSEGHDFLDKTKSMLEEYSDIFGKEATKRLRKAAAK